MRLNIEATEPVHWSIKATVGGDDLRRFARLLLKTVHPVLRRVAALFRQKADPTGVPLMATCFSPRIKGGFSMADKTYDAIVVGGGHQGTIIACYLAARRECRRSCSKDSMN